MSNLYPYRSNRSALAFPETNFFNEMMRPFFNNEPWRNAFRVDVHDTGDSYVLEADLPGMRRDQVGVSIEDGLLTISAQYDEENKESPEGYLINERRYGKMQRTFSVENVWEDRITAEYHDGVLKLTMPKRTEEKKISHKIEIQ